MPGGRRHQLWSLRLPLRPAQATLLGLTPIFDAVAYLFPHMRKSPFQPCIPTRAAKVPDRPDWIHEIKQDGYRPIVQREDKRVWLFARNGHDWSSCHWQ
jgi:ATP-dependent DNA ligase